MDCDDLKQCASVWQIYGSMQYAYDVLYNLTMKLEWVIQQKNMFALRKIVEEEQETQPQQHIFIQLMVNRWFGLVVWIPEIPL